MEEWYGRRTKNGTTTRDGNPTIHLMMARDGKTTNGKTKGRRPNDGRRRRSGRRVRNGMTRRASKDGETRNGRWNLPSQKLVEIPRPKCGPRMKTEGI
jgi:hypothetical protein